MSAGELVLATVADRRVWDASGEAAPNGVYLAGAPGRAYPFTVFRAWKVGTGTVSEELRIYGPSGEMTHRWGPVARRMVGAMDLTREVDLIEDATFAETGMHLASFIIDGEVVAELEFPVYLQQAPAKLPKELEDGLRKSDVVWIGVGEGAARRAAPSWFAYRNGRLYVLSRREPAADEQTLPGIPGATEVEVVLRRKGRDTALAGFRAAVRELEGAEWEDAAKALADRRRSRVGAPSESIVRWRSTCAIAELTPIVAG